MRNAKPITTGGAQEAADLASGYLATLTNDRLRTSPIDIPYVPFDSPFHRTWHQLKEQDEWAQARESGASVAEGIGYDAASDGASARMGQPGTKVMGWRRLLQPGACEWCQVVSTQLYHTQASATFGHLKCKCKPIAVPRHTDPTQKINEARLRDLRESVRCNGPPMPQQEPERDAGPKERRDAMTVPPPTEPAPSLDPLGQPADPNVPENTETDPATEDAEPDGLEGLRKALAAERKLRKSASARAKELEAYEQQVNRQPVHAARAPPRPVRQPRRDGRPSAAGPSTSSASMSTSAPRSPSSASPSVSSSRSARRC